MLRRCPREGKRMTAYLWRSPAAAVLVLSSFGNIHAQSTNASLNGRITDPSAAFIVGANVAAISADTNIRLETATNGSGAYYFSTLPPGWYQIEAEKAGFKKLIKPDVVLHVQDALELDLHMTLGSNSETVTVRGGAPSADTESPSVS